MDGDKKMSKYKKIFAVLLLGIVLTLVGCSSSANDLEKKEKIKVAYSQSGKPASWTNEEGDAVGYEVEVLKLVEEKLSDYEFEFIGTTDDDLLIGVEQGKYQAGIKNAFFTDERAAKYVYPKEFIGLSSIGIVLKEENKAVKNLEDFAKEDMTLAPIAANNAQYAVIEEFNEANPDNKVNLKAGDAFTIDIVQWVNEKRVDGGIMIEGSFNEKVLVEDAPYEKFKNDVVYKEFSVIKTWPLFNKKETDLADAYDIAIEELKEEGKLSELINEFYGRDLFEVLDEVER